jgi:hypothetical protein
MKGGTRSRSRLAILVLAVFLVAGAVAALASASSRQASVAVTFNFGPQSPFGGTRFDGQYVAYQKRVYFLGFRTFNNETDGSVWYYDTAARTYTDTGVDMPVPISNYGIAALTNSQGLGLYIFGGRDENGNIVDTTQVYYPDSNTAETLDDDPWPGTTPSGCVSLPAMGVAVVGNYAVVMGGLAFSANGCVDEQSAQTWVFDPTAAAGSRWTQGPDLKVARGYITPATRKMRVRTGPDGAIGSTVFAIGGDTNDAGNLVPSSTVEAWNFGGNAWNDKDYADLPQACDESQALVFRKGALADTLTLAGCGQWPNAVPDVLQYDVTGNAWSTVGTLNENRRNQAGAVISVGQNKMFILGGYTELNGFTDPTQTSEFGKPALVLGQPGFVSGASNPSWAGALPTN